MPIWQLLQKIGYNVASYSVDTDGSAAVPLDPILIPQADMTRISAIAAKHVLLHDILRHILTEEGFLELITDKMPSTRRVIYTAKRYAKHIADLQVWRLVEERPIKHIRNFVGYFSVLKTATASIVNTKRFSEFCTTPRPVNIPCITEVLKRLCLAASKGRFSLIFGDIRHFFHGISPHEAVSRFFGLCIDGKAYVWRRLPMGWSHSPVTAQAVGGLWLSGKSSGFISKGRRFNSCSPRKRERGKREWRWG